MLSLALPNAGFARHTRLFARGVGREGARDQYTSTDQLVSDPVSGEAES
jgi:hypothetical protein